MTEEETEKRCPYLEEAVMVSCNAYPIKKMVPRDRITTATRCFEGHFRDCPLYQEIMARIEALAGEETVPPAPRKGGSR
jgi:hypothetical protein